MLIQPSIIPVADMIKDCHQSMPLATISFVCCHSSLGTFAFQYHRESGCCEYAVVSYRSLAASQSLVHEMERQCRCCLSCVLQPQNSSYQVDVWFLNPILLSTHNDHPVDISCFSICFSEGCLPAWGTRPRQSTALDGLSGFSFDWSILGCLGAASGC